MTGANVVADPAATSALSAEQPPAVAITFPHGSNVDDPASAVPAVVNIPDRSIC
jgi:hypothetical protein